MHFDFYLPSPFLLMLTGGVYIDRIMQQNGPKHLVGWVCHHFILVTHIVQLPLTNLLWLVTSASKR